MKSYTKTVEESLNNTPMSMEEIFSELDQIITELEKSETSLEESFALYQTGVKLVQEAGLRIEHVEKDMIMLEAGEEVS